MIWMPPGLSARSAELVINEMNERFLNTTDPKKLMVEEALN